MKFSISLVSLMILFSSIATGTSIAHADSNYQADNSRNLNSTSFSNQSLSESQPMNINQNLKTGSLNDYISSYSQDTVTPHFEKNDFRLIQNPTVCAIEEDNASDSKQDLATETLYAVLDWSTKLNDGGGKNGPWHISFKKIPVQDSVKFDPSCDIVVRFFSSISSDDSYFVGIKSGGVTYYDSNQHKAYVKILYDGMMLPQIQGVIRHELGHALGLGHYIISEGTLKRIAIGLEDSPSIMVGVVPNDNHYSITPFDIEEIKRKYGNEGFQNIGDYQSTISQRQLISQVIPVESNSNSQQNDVNVVNSGKLLSQMIHDDVSDGTYFIGTGSVFVKDLIVEGKLKIPDSVDKSRLTYELPLSVRYHIVSSWAKGEKTDAELLNLLQSMVDSGKIDLTKHFREYEA
jgi:hypothetical protein